VRVSAMAARGEDVFPSVAATLAELWAGHEVQPGAVAGGQVWWLHPALSLCSHAPGPRARRYLRRAQRWSHRPARVLPQLVASRLLTSRAGLRAFRSAAFTVSPGHPDASELLVMPSNQRVRVLDFARARTQVIAKAGLSSASVAKELALRAGEGPWMPARRISERAFEEELLDGWPLPRRPPWCDVRAEVEAAIRRVEAWQGLDARATPARAWAQRLGARLASGLPDDLAAVLPIERMVAAAAALGEVEVSSTHGDLQPGNLFVRRDGHVVVIDWERAGRRWRPYDRWVWTCNARWGGHPPQHAPRGERALFWLEELCFFLDEASAFPGDVGTSTLRSRAMAACASWS